MRPFAYERPGTLADAIGLLAAHGPAARPLAGGTDLIIQLRDGSQTLAAVVDIKHVAELHAGIREHDGGLEIGALAVMTDISADPRVRDAFPALAESASVVGSVQIRNRATLAGNLCNASPAADTLPALLVYDATVSIAGPDGEREMPVDAFLAGPGRTALGPAEVVTAIGLPRPDGFRGSAHVRRTRRRGHDLASVTLACSVARDGRLRLAFGSVGPRPWLVTDDSGVLLDPAASRAARDAVLDRLFAAASPSPTSLRASPEYRLAMLRVLGLRAVEVARERLGRGTAA
jgi:carbon-monoxide dehydrogenase medium subunit